MLHIPKREPEIICRQEMKQPLDNPIDQFAEWFDQAKNAAIDKPNAMILSTSGAGGVPASRVVLLSSFSAQGFVFHTNYRSDKGDEIAQNNRVSLLFWWDSLGYQVRINGVAEKTSPEKSDAYFSGRPRGSQLGAWASEQSRVIASRDVLDKRLDEFTEQFESGEVPRPPHWGGYIVRPEIIEFWVNRENRLHDRFRFSRKGKEWHWQRLAP
jgi:pyridoxamine 5'-phosphate oxidase